MVIEGRSHSPKKPSRLPSCELRDPAVAWLWRVACARRPAPGPQPSITLYQPSTSSSIRPSIGYRPSFHRHRSFSNTNHHSESSNEQTFTSFYDDKGTHHHPNIFLCYDTCMCAFLHELLILQFVQSTI